MFKSMLVFSGASNGVNARLRASDIVDRVIAEQWGQWSSFQRLDIPGKASWHCLFSNTDLLWKETVRRGMNQRQDLSGWVFSEQPPAGGEPVNNIKLVYSAGYALAQYRYDPGRGGYLRYAQGDFTHDYSTAPTPHLDELTGQQLAPPNVVVLYARHVDSDILEDTYGGGHWCKEIQIWGEGVARIFRDGMMYNVKWVRPSRHEMIRFLDGAGKPFPFKPGPVWIQVVPLDFQVQLW